MKGQRPTSTISKRPGGLPPARLHRVIDYIETHLREGMTLRDMAELVPMSPYHFGRLFKQSTGLSPHQYLLRRRVEKAKELLSRDAISVAEISRRLGFASRAHFTTVFRKQVGKTPRDFRLNAEK